MATAGGLLALLFAVPCGSLAGEVPPPEAIVTPTPETAPGTGLAGTVTVRLASGRVLTGNIGPRTDASLLWLCTRRGSIELARPVEWEQVVQAALLGQTLTGGQLRQAVADVRRDLPAQAEVPPNRMLVLIGKPNADGPAVLPSRMSQKAYVPSPVRHLSIDAAVGDWSDTVEADGLTVYVYPVDGAGAMVPVLGTLEVDLTGVRTSVSPPPQPFFNLARWTCVLRPEDFGPRGAMVRLPFQAVQPEFDTNVFRYGAVHARLSVAGQGTFDATQSTVRIRPTSPFRDALQRSAGERFVPQERLGRQW
jgi:hypothetical protein